jgi:hypothetical protein
MVQRVTCSADKISKLTNPQIEYIIEQVKLKTITDQSSVDEISSTTANTSANGSNSEEEGTNVSAPIMPIPAGPSNSLEDVDDYYKMILEDCAEDCVYFDSAPHPVEETNDDNDCSHDNDSEEEMPDDSEDSDDDRYGGYNEYGERDRGYYYRDGGYERKTSPMMSPIISSVTA